MDYANQQMALTFTDPVAQTSFTTNLNVGDLTQLIGTNTAYIGFTGASGGSTAVQTISNFSFVSIPSVSVQLSGTNVLISWTGGAPGYVPQQNPDLAGNNWVNLTNLPVVTNGLSQVTAPRSVSSLFYRLSLPRP
jgi:hypothetical protein